MSNGELLLELLTEEIPARMQRRAIDDLVSLIRDKLAEAEIPAESIKGYVTPRRLTVIASGIPERQPDRSEERRGPRVGAPQNAVEGFLRAAGLSSIEQCELRDTGRGEFYFAIVHRPGRPAAEVLPELLRAAIGELSWPKSMRFQAATFQWVRPLASAICLLDGKVLPLPLDDVPVGNTTRGHRFLSEGEIAVESAADYLDKLEHAYVVLDHERRRDIIKADLDRLAAAEGLAVKPDPGLLEEVAGLVEFPVVLMGAIDDSSMGLPPEVLATAMRTHQKYFSCLNADGAPAPRFLFVANNLTPDDGKTIVAGNERVLKARLADARFFWDQDRKIRLEDRVEALKDRVYHAKLGSVYEKVQRTEQLVDFLVSHYPFADTARARRAVHLSKADLSTGMVGEFPELQGTMGRYYALNDGENPEVADAIAEHYKPLGPNDNPPTTPLSIIAALADKLDTLVALFSVGERPTGSGDPFALRRTALGVIRIILRNGMTLPLSRALTRAAESLPSGASDRTNELLGFFAERLRADLRAMGYGHDLVAAVFTQGDQAEPIDNFPRLMTRVAAIDKFVSSEDGANLLVAYRRASNIVRIEEQRDKCSYDREVDPALLHEATEQELYRALDRSADDAQKRLAQDNFERAMAALASLRRPVDEFFDKVTVNADDPALRENRLRLLSRIRSVMNQVADFSQIEG
jgi:glycyl-tRNA synthetase beta chain